MSGEDFQEDAVLAAVKPLKTANFSDASKRPSPTADLATSLGTVDTLEVLFQQHHQRIVRTAYRVTGSAADAEDVLQTVFLRVARGQETAVTADNTEA